MRNTALGWPIPEPNRMELAIGPLKFMLREPGEGALVIWVPLSPLCGTVLTEPCSCVVCVTTADSLKRRKAKHAALRLPACLPFSPHPPPSVFTVLHVLTPEKKEFWGKVPLVSQPLSQEHRSTYNTAGLFSGPVSSWNSHLYVTSDYGNIGGHSTSSAIGATSLFLECRCPKLSRQHPPITGQYLLPGSGIGLS